MIWLVVFACVTGNCEAESVKSYEQISACKGDLEALQFVSMALPREVGVFHTACTESQLSYWPQGANDLGFASPNAQI